MQLIKVEVAMPYLWQKQRRLSIYKAIDVSDIHVAYIFVWSRPGTTSWAYARSRNYTYAEISIVNYDNALSASSENVLIAQADSTTCLDERENMPLSDIRSELTQKYESKYDAITFLQNLPVPNNANGKITSYQEINGAKSLLVKHDDWPKIYEEVSKQEVANPNFGNKQNIGLVVTAPGKNSLFVDNQGNQFLIVRSKPFELNSTKYEVITLVPRTNKFDITNAKIT